MKRLSMAIVGAMAESLKYGVSYPMVGLPEKPALDWRLPCVARVAFWVRDMKGAWRELHVHFENPMVKVRRALKVGPGGQFLMEVREEAAWPAGPDDWDAARGEAHRLVTLESCMRDPRAVRGMVDDVVREALTGAYGCHPQGAAFLAELARYYRWEREGDNKA